MSKSEWQQIIDQIDAIIRAIPEHYLLDPPDGGDVSVAEGVGRMASRIEQLEREQHLIVAERDRTFALMLARAEQAEARVAELEAALHGVLNCIGDIPVDRLQYTKICEARAALKGGDGQ